MITGMWNDPVNQRGTTVCLITGGGSAKAWVG
jgi:hypothetical protein